MNVLVVGCGRVGAELAHRLYEKHHQVTVIDEVASAFENLPPDFRGRTVEGEVLSQDVLHRAGIEDCQGMAAVTNSDSLNAVVAHLARTLYHVPNVVVRSYDPRQRSLLEAFDVQVVSPSSWGAQRMEEMLSDSSVHTVFSAGNGEVEVYEMVVPEAWTGHSLEDLVSGEQCAPVALTRAGQSMLPACNTALKGGDIVHISATADGIAYVRLKIRMAQEA